MKLCLNPFCDNEIVNGRSKFCRDSCRASYHQNHKLGLHLVLRELIRSDLVKMGTGAEKAEIVARNLYRVAKGKEPTRQKVGKG